MSFQPLCLALLVAVGYNILVFSVRPYRPRNSTSSTVYVAMAGCGVQCGDWNHTGACKVLN